MNLIGPTQIESLGGNKYNMVIIDDYLRYILAILLIEKFESFDLARKLFKRLQIKKTIFSYL